MSKQAALTIAVSLLIVLALIVLVQVSQRNTETSRAAEATNAAATVSAPYEELLKQLKEITPTGP